jgi:hypothetical protein
MGSNTEPVHGKLIALYVLRPNGFNGIGLNDLTWGLAAANAATSYYEVVIDHAGGTDSFKWRKNGGAWTEDVNITGAAQTLDESQTLTFAATTGHTAGDQWVIGNLVAEATTESGADAQITTAGNRILNPNRPPVWTDSGGKVAQIVNFCNGKATFSGNVGTVTVAGNNGYVPAAALKKCAYLIDWNANFTLDMSDCSRAGQHWKEGIPGQAGGSGSANAWFIATESMFWNLKNAIEGGNRYNLLQLFTWDASQDQTGDHYNAWATFTSFALAGGIGAVVKETVNFQIQGAAAFVADT